MVDRAFIIWLASLRENHVYVRLVYFVCLHVGLRCTVSPRWNPCNGALSKWLDASPIRSIERLYAGRLFCWYSENSPIVMLQSKEDLSLSRNWATNSQAKVYWQLCWFSRASSSSWSCSTKAPMAWSYFNISPSFGIILSNFLILDTLTCQNWLA